MNLNACFDELLKLGAVSDEQATAAVNRLDTLERNKATPGRVARYAAVGAATAPVIAGVGNAIRGKGFRNGLSGVKHLREVAGDAAKGGLAAGAVPVIQQHLDHKAEVHTLKKYLTENGVEMSDA